jgi:hypothetical protein
VLTSESTIEIGGLCVFGQVTVIVPEGVEVDLTGAVVFSSHDLRLAPVPRVPCSWPRTAIRPTSSCSACRHFSSCWQAETRFASSEARFAFRDAAI